MTFSGFVRGGLRLAAAGGIAAGLMFSAPASAETTLKAVMHAPLRVLDPILTTAAITVAHSYMVYDQLFGLDADLKPRPQMVDTWTVSDDELTYRFVLRDGLAFSDGRPVTAEDVVASINRWRQRDSMAQVLNKSLKSVDVIDDKTFAVVLNEPFGWLLYAFGKVGSNLLVIMPKEVAATPATEAVKDFTGSGPFVFKADEFKPGVKTVYTKNPHYKPRTDEGVWNTGRKEAMLDRVEWLVLPDMMTAVNALINGEIDYLESLPADLAPLLEGEKNVTVAINNPMGWQGHLRMNTLHPPFDNPKIRRAVLMGLNQEDFMRAQVGDPKLYRVCYALFTCGTWLKTEAGSEGLLRGDVEGAKKLLKEAGYDGTKVVLLHPTDFAEATAYGPITAQTLRAIGFNVDMQVMDWSAVQTRRAKMDPPDQGGWNIFHSNWSAFTVSNPISNQPLNGAGKKAWLGWPEDAKIEEMRAAFAKESDPEKQKALAVEIQKRGYEIASYAALGEYFPRIAYRSAVKNVPVGSGTWFWNMTLDKKR